jgi:tryptophanyl-tRNA synthetase
MSKTYGNAIPLFLPEKQLRKAVMKIKTNSLEPGEPKDTADSILFAIYAAYAPPDEVAAVRRRYAEGIAWGEMKQLLFETLDKELRGMRAEYDKLIANPAHVESVLRAGAAKAREISVPFLADIRRRVGVRPLA